MPNYPDIPEDTSQAALSLYGKGNLYIRLGDQLDEFLDGLISPEVMPWLMKDRDLEKTIQCAMLTVFQYIEELTNKKMLETLQNRTDLKYALHLPKNFPNLNPNTLCEFRKQLYNNPADQKFLQNLLDRFIEFGFLKLDKNHPVDTNLVLDTICTMTRFEEIEEAMYRLLESLAVNDPEWLRLVTMPYWYERYKVKRKLPPLPVTDEIWKARALQIGRDLQYLLEEIDKSKNFNLASLREIREIRQLWEQGFETTSQEAKNHQECIWRPARCAECRMHPNP